MSHLVFDYRDYKQFLKQELKTDGKNRGIRSKLALRLNCQVSFLSQVLNGNSHFTLEHGASTADFLNLKSAEEHFFMLLLQRQRAGNKDLKNYFEKQIQLALEKNSKIRERIKVKGSLDPQTQSIYYSAWYYSAVHVLTSIEKYQHPESIAVALNLSQSIVKSVLKFLCEVGLVNRVGQRFIIENFRVHLGDNARLIQLHHTNWRLRTVQLLDRKLASDLHFSSVVTLSESDAVKIRTILLEAIEKSEPILRESKQEEGYCMALDFFRL